MDGYKWNHVMMISSAIVVAMSGWKNSCSVDTGCSNTICRVSVASKVGF